MNSSLFPTTYCSSSTDLTSLIPSSTLRVTDSPQYDWITLNGRSAFASVSGPAQQPGIIITIVIQPRKNILLLIKHHYIILRITLTPSAPFFWDHFQNFAPFHIKHFQGIFFFMNKTGNDKSAHLWHCIICIFGGTYLT